MFYCCEFNRVVYIDYRCLLHSLTANNSASFKGQCRKINLINVLSGLLIIYQLNVSKAVFKNLF